MKLLHLLFEPRYRGGQDDKNRTTNSLTIPPMDPKAGLCHCRCWVAANNLPQLITLSIFLFPVKLTDTFSIVHADRYGIPLRRRVDLLRVIPSFCTTFNLLIVPYRTRPAWRRHRSRCNVYFWCVIDGMSCVTHGNLALGMWLTDVWFPENS